MDREQQRFWEKLSERNCDNCVYETMQSNIPVSWDLYQDCTHEHRWDLDYGDEWCSDENNYKFFKRKKK